MALYVTICSKSNYDASQAEVLAGVHAGVRIDRAASNGRVVQIFEFNDHVAGNVFWETSKRR
jgi:hypothetical protein